MFDCMIKIIEWLYICVFQVCHLEHKIIITNGSSLTRMPIEPISTLLEHFRLMDITIIHTREGHRADLSDLPANKLWRSQKVIFNCKRALPVILNIYIIRAI